MIANIKRVFFLWGTTLIFMSCQNQNIDIDLSTVDKNTSIHRFDSAFFNADTTQFLQQLSLLEKKYPVFFESESTDLFWKNQRLDEKQNILYQTAQKAMPNFTAIEEELNIAMKHYYYYYNNAPTIHFYSYISNLDFNYPVLYSKERNVCFIATDLYLGAEQPQYQHLARYLAFERQAKFLVRDCIAAIAEAEIPNSKESTMLDAMLAYGKRLYFIETMMPQHTKEIIIKYPSEKLQFAIQNERSIWSYFIEQKLLYTSKKIMLQRFLEPAPFSKFGTQKDAETPGRIGQWLGWQIVKSYVKNNPNSSLQEMLNETDSRKFLKLSGYKP